RVQVGRVLLLAAARLLPVQGTATEAARARSAVLTFLLAALLIPGAAVAQESAPTPPTVRTAVAPDTVLVGDVFRVAIRVELPPGDPAAFPDSLPVSDPLVAAEGPYNRIPSLPDAHRRYIAVSAMTA